MSTVSSSSTMQAALSPNQKLVAVLPPSATGASKSPTQRWTLPLYSVVSRSLQATLTWNPSSDMKTTDDVSLSANAHSSPWQRLVFFNDDHVAGLFQHRHVVVWNVPRGIVSYTIDLLKGKKEDDKLILLDIVTPLTTTTNDSTSSSFYYALVQKESKLYVYEYAIETGKLQRKIKCGHADQQQSQSNHATLSLAVVVTSSSNDDAPPQGRILLTTGRRQVKVISLSSGQKVSKMKLTADTNGSLTALTSGSSASAASGTVVVAIPTASGVVIAKLVLGEEKEELTPVATLPIKLEDSHDQQQQQGALQMWLKTTTTSTTAAPTKTKSASPTVDLMLLLNQTDLYEYPNINNSSNSKTAAPVSLQPSCRLERDLSTKQEDQQHVVLAMSNASLWHQVVAVLYRRGQGVLIKSIPLVQNADDASTTTYRDKITLSYQEDGALDATIKDDGEAAAGKKRKQSQNVATTLGPGQAGHELVKVSDRPTKKQAKKQDEDVTETPGDEGDGGAAVGTSGTSLTIAERLQQLAALAEEDDDEDDDDDEDAAMDTSGVGKDENKQLQIKFVPKQATTQSLTHLLQQACASNDDGLLELALSVRDVRVIEQSMYELTQQQQQQQEAAAGEEGDAPTIKWMDVLLTRLITRLANKPQRAEALSLWIQCWLKQHQQWEANASSSSSSWQSVQGLLQPLRNLLQERVQTFSLWLQLEGRLSMMKS